MAASPGPVVHTLTLSTQWSISGVANVSSLAPIGGVAGLCPLSRWYADAVADALMRPAADSRVVGASFTSVAVLLAQVSSSDGTFVAAPANGPNAPASEACPQLPETSGSGVSAPRQLARRPLNGVQRAVDGGSATGRFLGGSASGGIGLLFTIAVNSSRVLEVAAVQAALEGLVAAASAREQLKILIAALSMAVGAAATSAEDVEVSFTSVTVTNNEVIALAGASVSASPSAAVMATAKGAEAGFAFSPLSIGIGAGIGAVAALAFGGAGFAVWLQIRKRRQSLDKLRGKDNTSASARAGADGPDLRMQSNPSLGGGSGGSRVEQALGSAGSLRLHSNSAVALSAYGGRAAQLRTNSNNASGSGGTAGTSGAAKLRTAAGSVQAAIRATAALQGAAALRSPAAGRGQAAPSRRPQAGAAPAVFAPTPEGATGARASTVAVSSAGIVHNPLHARLSFMATAAGAAPNLVAAGGDDDGLSVSSSSSSSSSSFSERPSRRRLDDSSSDSDSSTGSSRRQSTIGDGTLASTAV